MKKIIGQSRSVVSLLLAVVVSAVLIGCSESESKAPVDTSNPPGSLRLLAPTGPYVVGTQTARFSDDRTDPLAPVAAKREVMAQVWYPARSRGDGERAAYSPAQSAAANEKQFSLAPGALANTRSHAYVDAPVRNRSRAYPLVVYSHGLGGSRTDNTVAAEQLASNGFVVIGIDSTYESPAIVFPGERVIEANPETLVGIGESPERLTRLAELRAGDVNMVIRQVRSIGFTKQLRDSIDFEKIGTFGHSMGGATAVQAMYGNEDIDAALDLDGFIQGSVTNEGVDRPVYFMAVENHTLESDPTWGQVFPKLKSFHKVARVANTGHYSFTDYGGSAIDWGLKSQMPPEAWAANFGDIDGARAQEITRSYVYAYFDQMLRGNNHSFLDTEVSEYPEVKITDQ